MFRNDVQVKKCGVTLNYTFQAIFGILKAMVTWIIMLWHVTSCSLSYTYQTSWRHNPEHSHRQYSFYTYCKIYSVQHKYLAHVQQMTQSKIEMKIKPIFNIKCWYKPIFSEQCNVYHILWLNVMVRDA
jgi:hypothetical protein